ncbi:hypothetical protein GGI42DRAFT_93498 [Trichoderma sp. SZMC 28013]
MAAKTRPRPSPSPSNQSTCGGPNLANLATVDTTSIKGGLVGLGSANRPRLKAILRARGGDLEGRGRGRGEEREKGKREKGRRERKKKGPSAAENASACTRPLQQLHQHSTVRDAARVVVDGAKPKKRAISESSKWMDNKRRGSRRQCLAPPRCSAWHARVQDPVGSWRTRVRRPPMSEVGAVDKIIEPTRTDRQTDRFASCCLESWHGSALSLSLFLTEYLPTGPRNYRLQYGNISLIIPVLIHV